MIQKMLQYAFQLRNLTFIRQCSDTQKSHYLKYVSSYQDYLPGNKKLTSDVIS